MAGMLAPSAKLRSRTNCDRRCDGRAVVPGRLFFENVTLDIVSSGEVVMDWETYTTRRKI